MGVVMAKAIHTMIRVLDLDRSIDFYDKAFGLKVADHIDFDGFALGCTKVSGGSDGAEDTLRKVRGIRPDQPGRHGLL